MRKADYPFLADWFAITLRWLVLLGILCILAFTDTTSVLLVIIAGLLAGWNTAVSVLAILNRRLTNHRLINTLVDLFASLLFFTLSGGLTGWLVWIGLLVLLTASIYYEWRGSILTALGLSLIQVAIVYFTGYTPFNSSLVGVLVGINVVTSLILGVLSGKLMELLRANYQSKVRNRKEADRQLQFQERNRIQAFYQMLEELSATLNYEHVMETALELSSTVLVTAENPVTDLCSAVLLFNNENLVVVSTRHFSGTDSKTVFPAQEGALYQVIQSGEPVLTTNIEEDPELIHLVTLQACKSVLLLPLRRGMNAYGAMLFAHPSQDFFSPERIELLETISHQAVIAIQNALLFQDVQKEKEHIVETQEEARKKLARDLHDGPIQSVSAIAMRLSVARRMLQMAPRDVGGELEQIEDMARRTTNEIRHMLFTLRPLALETEGLESALKTMAIKMHDTFQQNVDVEVESQVLNELDSSKQTVVFYLVEEALNNARKHAEATLIRVRLRHVPQNSSFAMLEIADNGVGFDVDSVNKSYDKRSSLGMVNLRERTELVSGQLRILSAPGKGTRVQVIIPLTQEAMDRLHH